MIFKSIVIIVCVTMVMSGCAKKTGVAEKQPSLPAESRTSSVKSLVSNK
jgi:uncharacterized lipoprotein YajG